MKYVIGKAMFADVQKPANAESGLFSAAQRRVMAT